MEIREARKLAINRALAWCYGYHLGSFGGDNFEQDQAAANSRLYGITGMSRTEIIEQIKTNEDIRRDYLDRLKIELEDLIR
jgi:hypothetical protein